MNDDVLHSLKTWLFYIANLIEHRMEPEASFLISFKSSPWLSLEIVDIVANLDEKDAITPTPIYSACIFAMDLAVSELQVQSCIGSLQHRKVLSHLMEKLVDTMLTEAKSLSFWLPLLNAFYDAEVELSERLREAYLILAEREESVSEEQHLHTMREMLQELSDLSVFEMTDNLFAQGHAMTPEVFRGVVIDLLNIEEGREVALLALLHPKIEVREVVFETIDVYIDEVTFNSRALLRLERLKSWFPPSWQAVFQRWIHLQRKKGVLFFKEAMTPRQDVIFFASEVDGSGAQGVFAKVRTGKSYELCGILFREKTGIADAWVTQFSSNVQFKQYQKEAFDGSVTLRTVNFDYFVLMSEHFLSRTLDQGGMPELSLVEMMELLGIELKPNPIQVKTLLETLAVEIVPFTPETMKHSLLRAKTSLLKKRFTESWIIECPEVDRLVNQLSVIVEGVRVCDIPEATRLVLYEKIETARDYWCFHFLWTALWLKASQKKNETVWEDAFFIAYYLFSDSDIKALPIFWEISRQSVLNSIETMGDRGTHLSGSGCV